MSLLTICQGLALNVGMTLPTVVIGANTRDWQEATQMANEVGEELSRRVDWTALRTVTVLTGTGAAVLHQLPSDYARLSGQLAGVVGTTPIRALTDQEWTLITAAVGTPRYVYVSQRDALSSTVEYTAQLFPFLANAAVAQLYYQSEKWVYGGATSFTVDTDVSRINEDLLLKGLIVRWRRQKGMDYADQEAEYEAALQQFAKFDSGLRA